MKIPTPLSHRGVKLGKEEPNDSVPASLPTRSSWLPEQRDFEIIHEFGVWGFDIEGALVIRISTELLGGSWVVVSGLISKVTIDITHIKGLITPLITTHQPPSKIGKDSGFDITEFHGALWVLVGATSLKKSLLMETLNSYTPRFGFAWVPVFSDIFAP